MKYEFGSSLLDCVIDTLKDNPGHYAVIKLAGCSVHSHEIANIDYCFIGNIDDVESEEFEDANYTEVTADIDNIIGMHDTFVSVVLKPTRIIVIENTRLNIKMELSNIDSTYITEFVTKGVVGSLIEYENNLTNLKLIVSLTENVQPTEQETEKSINIPVFPGNTSVKMKVDEKDTLAAYKNNPFVKQQYDVSGTPIVSNGVDVNRMVPTQEPVRSEKRMTLGERLKAAMQETSAYMAEPVTEKTLEVNNHPYEPDIPNVDPSKYVSEEENRLAQEQATEQAKKEHIDNVALADALLNSDIEMDNSDFEEEK
jgi:hypothetical protein